MLKTFSAAFLAFSMVACSMPEAAQEANADSRPTSRPSAPVSMLDTADYEFYANGVHAGGVVDVADVLSDPASFQGRTIRVRGDIAKVCPVKGCWVKVGPEANSLFVKFQNCDSYLPVDLTGSLICEGEMEIKTISVEEQKHLLEDEGKHDEAAKITSPRKTVRMVASGAAMKR